MQIVIEIAEESYKEIKKIVADRNDHYFLENIIANGTPLSKGCWISRADMDYIDENKVTNNHFMCKYCGFIHNFIDGHTSQYIFCPNCGAKMDWSDKE